MYLSTSNDRRTDNCGLRSDGNPRAEMATPTINRLDYESELWRGGLTRVAGVDEAGRGPLAGPVVAAAVILPSRGVKLVATSGCAG